MNLPVDYSVDRSIEYPVDGSVDGSVDRSINRSKNLLDQRVSELKSARPSGVTLLELTSLSRYELTPDGRVDLLAALERHASWLNSQIHEVTYLISLDQPGSQAPEPFNGYGAAGAAMTSELNDQEREEIAAALHISPNSAQHRINTATLLVHHLPEISRALADGSLSTAHANVIAREAAPLIYGGADKSIVSKIEAKALATAEFSTPNQVAVALRKAIAQVAPQELEERFASAREERRVIYYPERDGMATISALLTAPDARLVMRSLEEKLRALSAHSATNHSAAASATTSASTTASSASTTASSASTNVATAATADQRRADAFVQFFTEREVNNQLPSREVHCSAQQEGEIKEKISKQDRSSAMTINVIVDLPTLLGLADNPAELSGYGAIPASLARELATSHLWRRFITDPITGELLDVGREKYVPPQGLIDFIKARDKTCRFPGCQRAADFSDIDHAIPWEEGGTTSLANLGLLCRRHHRLKTHGGWKISSNPDGSCTWISPYGKEYFVPARPVHEVA